MTKEVQCPDCEGQGMVNGDEEFVTHDMALDACEPLMEGMSLGIILEPCPTCGGGGVILEEEND